MKPSDYVRRGWCQGASAMNGEGLFTLPTNSTATSWCLVGAIYAAYPDSDGRRQVVFDKLRTHRGHPLENMKEMVEWNDDRSRDQWEVAELLESIGE